MGIYLLWSLAYFPNFQKKYHSIVGIYDRWRKSLYLASFTHKLIYVTKTSTRNDTYKNDFLLNNLSRKGYFFMCPIIYIKK